MKKNFIAAGHSLIEENGADVIIVHGITQCPVHMKPDELQQGMGRAGGRRHRRADPDGGDAGGPRAQAQPPALAEVDGAAEAVR